MNVQVLIILFACFAIGNSLYCYHCREGSHCVNLEANKVFTLPCNRSSAFYKGIFPSDFYPTLNFPEKGNSTNGHFQCLSAGNSSVTNRFCIKGTELMVKRVCDSFLNSNGKFCKACSKDDCNTSNSVKMSLYSLLLVSSFVFMKSCI